MTSSFSNARRFGRRTFLRGLGACVALPAFESLLPARALAADAVGSRRCDRHRRPAALGVRVLPQRRHSAGLVARGRRRRLQAEPDARAAGVRIAR